MSTVAAIAHSMLGGQRGLVAVTPFAAGTAVLPLHGQWLPSPTRHTLQIDLDRHLHPGDALWALLNHACRPNLRLDIPQLQVVARCDIPAGAELTLNYLSSEWLMAEPFVCTCGSVDCLGRIGGFSRLSAAQQQRLLPEVTSALRQLWQRQPR